MFANLGESPPWEQFVGEVRGLVLLGVWRCGVRPMVLLGEPWEKVVKDVEMENTGNLLFYFWLQLKTNVWSSKLIYFLLKIKCGK